MDWNDIGLILAIARTGSFSAAANSLSTSKPTVSRRIETLEKSTNLRIFIRSPHGAVLTQDGRTLLQKAMKIEEEVIDFERTLRDLGSHSQRPISISMSEGVASYLMTPVLAGQELGPLGVAARRTSIELPPIKMVTSHNTGEDIRLKWLPKGALPEGAPSDKIVRLAEISFVPFISKHYRNYAPGVSDRFDELSKHHTIVTLDAYKSFIDDGWSAWHRLTDDIGRKAIGVSWSSSVGHLVVNGAGIGLLPTYSPMYAGDLVKMEVAAPAMIGVLWMASSDATYQNPAVRHCFSKMKRLFSGARWV